MRRATIFGSAVATTLALTFFCVGGSSMRDGSARGQMCIAGHCCCTGRAEAETVTAKTAQGALTLDPKQFEGPAREAYKFAGKNPALLAQLHCYCGCDKAYSHQSLLDCYRGTHGANCEICIEEALQAERMSEQGSQADEIREAIRRRFAPEY